MAGHGAGLSPAQLQLMALQQEIAAANGTTDDTANTANIYADYMQQYQNLLTSYGSSSSSSGVALQGEQALAAAAAATAVSAAPEPTPAKSREEIMVELQALEEEVKQSEDRAKRAASQSKHFVGIIARFDTRKGHGFVACPETYRKYKQDIFIDRESYQTAKVGDTVVFSLGFNKKGAVRACDVRKLNEVSRLKAELDQKRQQFLGVPGTILEDRHGIKRANPWNASGSSWAEGSTWSDNHNGGKRAANASVSSWAEGSTWSENHTGGKHTARQFVQW